MKKGTLHMAILQPKVDKPKKDLKPHEYETTRVTVDLDQMPLEDKIEWQKKQVIWCPET
jgi:hypothetical protein